MCLALGVAVVSAGTGLIAQGMTPGAPSNLTYQANGGLVLLNWISSPGMTPTFVRTPASTDWRPHTARARLRFSPGTAQPVATRPTRARCSTC